MHFGPPVSAAALPDVIPTTEPARAGPVIDASDGKLPMYKIIAGIALLATAAATSSSSASPAGFGSTGMGSAPLFHGARSGSPGFPPQNRFVPGAGFVQGRCPRSAFVRCAGAGSVSAAYPDDEDDIEKLHFRVQEPFGPWDIGRSPGEPEP